MSDFESTIDDEWRGPSAPVPPEHPVIALPEIAAKLNASRRYPEVIFVKDSKSVSPVEDLLREVYGNRGARVTVLHSPDEREAFTIRWG